MSMTGELWWNRMTNAVRFLSDAEEALELGKSVVLNFTDEIPWCDIMTDVLRQRLEKLMDTRTFDIHDGAGVKDAGEFLFKRYCSESERQKYWPTKHKSHERFLAQNLVTPIHHRFICITDISSEDSPSWFSTVTEYVENCPPENEHALFILLTKNAPVHGSELIDVLQYSDYITDYDCMMLCMTMISSLSCNRAQKMYLSEVASNIADNNIELAGLLICAELELAKKPIQVTNETFQENGIKMTSLKEKVDMAVWEAQIKFVFPKLEKFRRSLIQKYQDRLSHLPAVTASNGETIDNPDELEIGQLYYICRVHKFIEPEELQLLRKMRNARNTLAHWQCLSYQELLDLNIL